MVLIHRAADDKPLAVGLVSFPFRFCFLFLFFFLLFLFFSPSSPLLFLRFAFCPFFCNFFCCRCRRFDSLLRCAVVGPVSLFLPFHIDFYWVSTEFFLPPTLAKTRPKTKPCFQGDQQFVPSDWYSISQVQFGAPFLLLDLAHTSDAFTYSTYCRFNMY